MSGKKISSDGERERCPLHGKERRLSRREINEIKRAIEVENSRARREGKTPKDAQIVRFSCTCNCFHVNVDD